MDFSGGKKWTFYSGILRTFLPGLDTGRLGVQVSASTVRRALHAIRFSWHRPKLTPARQPDPQRATREARLAEVLASSPDATLIAADECEAHLLAVLVAAHRRATPPAHSRP